MSRSLTFADVLIFQPESPLDLLVWVPDRAGFLKAVDSFLDVVVAKLVQQGYKSPRDVAPSREWRALLRATEKHHPGLRVRIHNMGIPNSQALQPQICKCHMAQSDAGELAGTIR